MAYSAQDHKIFSERMRNFARGYAQARVEAEALDQIYRNETASGTHRNFTDTSIATKQQHIDMIVFMRSFLGFTDGITDEAQLDRRSVLSAFTVE